MIITEAELRELWRDGRRPLPAFPPGTRFSPAAQDFIKDHQLVIRFAAGPVADRSVPSLPVTHYQLPRALDSLHALAMLTAAEARRSQLPALARQLDALADDCLGLCAAHQQGRHPAPLTSVPAGPPFTPGPTDPAILHWLNFLRASAAQSAAAAAGAGQPAFAAALAQVSAAAAHLAARVHSGELGWNPAGDMTHH